MRFGGIALAAVLLLGACSGDPSPKEPTETASKPTPTSTATLPAMPDQAKEDSPEGAAAFVTYWVKVSNYAAATGDVKELSRLSSPNCEGCQSYIDLYRETYERGGYFIGGDWRLEEVNIAQAADVRYVETRISWGGSRYRTDADADEEAGAAGEETITFEYRDGLIHQLGTGSVQ